MSKFQAQEPNPNSQLCGYQLGRDAWALYCIDPKGVGLEFCRLHDAWTREAGSSKPVTAT